MAVAVVWVAIIAFVAFYQWLRHQRRVLVHRERLAAFEKGIDPPPLEQEVRRGAWNAQRILLLAGLTWISIGVGAFVVLSALLASGSPASAEIPRGLQWIGVAPVGIGLSHLVVYRVGRTAPDMPG
jgi:hypothetical protein